MDLAPLRHLWLSGGFLGQLVLLGHQPQQFRFQFLLLVQVFLLGDLAFGPHIQERFLLGVQSLDPGEDVGQVRFCHLGGAVAVADQLASVINKITPFPKDLLQHLLCHQLQLPIGDHGLITVAGIIGAGISAVLGRAVVEDVVTLIAVGGGSVHISVPNISSEGATATAFQSASPQIPVFLGAMAGYFGVGAEAVLDAPGLDLLHPMPFLFRDNGGEIALHIHIGGAVKIVDPPLLQLVVAEGFAVGHDAHIGLIVQHPGHNAVGPLVDTGGVKPPQLCEAGGDLSRAHAFV